MVEVTEAERMARYLVRLAVCMKPLAKDNAFWAEADAPAALEDIAEALTTAQAQAQAAAQEQRIADALAWLRDHIEEVDDDNSYWGGPHKRAYLDAPAILKELTARAALGEQQ